MSAVRASHDVRGDHCRESTTNIRRKAKVGIAATALVHGDYRLDNVIFSGTSPHVDAVIDWELATLGIPLADLGYYLLSWVVPVGPSGGAALARDDLAELGIPILDAVTDRYFARTAFDRPEDFSYYFAYNLYRVAAILHGIGEREKHGNASSTKASTVGQLAGPAIDLACHIGGVP